MKTVKEEISNTIVIDKSEFINVIIPIDNKDNVRDVLDDVKSRWKDATHYCYAYIIGDYKKSTDDNEPGGTAGVPMMEVLNTFELTDVIAITIRYFGGIKLGAGGLVRAYRKSILDNININKDKIINVTDGYLVELETTYDKQKEIEYIFKRIVNKEYDQTVKYKLKLTKEEYDNYKDKFDFTIIDNIKVEINKDNE